MSLRAFHVLFIVLAALLAVALGVFWLGREGNGAGLAAAVASFAGAGALAAYGGWFVRKTARLR